MLKKMRIALGCLGLTMMAQSNLYATNKSNQVLFTANQPMKITYRVGHKNLNKQPIFGDLQTISVDKNVRIPISLNNYDKARVVIIAANGHELPSTANQFDQPEQCSMTTDKAHTTGTLKFTLAKHSLSCTTYGGVFS